MEALRVVTYSFFLFFSHSRGWFSLFAFNWCLLLTWQVPGQVYLSRQPAISVHGVVD